MKKITFLFLLMAITVSGMSQLPLFSLKLMGGVNIPSFEVQSATESLNKANYTFSLDAALGKKNYIQPGLAIRKYKGDFTLNGVKSDITIPTFNIHAYYGHQLINLKIVRWRMFGGLGYDMYSTPKSKKFTINPDDYNPSAINFVVGTELKVWFMLVSLQYEFGLTDMTANYAMKNNIFVAKVGYSFL